MKYYSYLLVQVEILHKYGLVHRNLDPNLILASTDCEIMILDAFRAVDNQLLKEDCVNYPPKTKSNKTKEDDCHSIGLILLEMSFGGLLCDTDICLSLSMEKIEELFKEKIYSHDFVEILIDLLINRRIATLKVRLSKRACINIPIDQERNRSIYRSKINRL